MEKIERSQSKLSGVSVLLCCLQYTHEESNCAHLGRPAFVQFLVLLFEITSSALGNSLVLQCSLCVRVRFQSCDFQSNVMNFSFVFSTLLRFISLTSSFCHPCVSSRLRPPCHCPRITAVEPALISEVCMIDYPSVARTIYSYRCCCSFLRVSAGQSMSPELKTGI